MSEKRTEGRMQARIEELEDTVRWLEQMVWGLLFCAVMSMLWAVTHG